MATKLNLGCSDDLKQGWVNVDIGPAPDVALNPASGADYQQADLNRPWPWPDSSVDEIYAHDVFEHLWPTEGSGTVGVRFCAPGKIWPMNEAHRVLKPGGILDLTVPCVYLSDGGVNPGAFADPTHRTYWTLDDRYYYGEKWNTPADERGRFGEAYGITALFRGEWKLFEYGNSWERRSKIMARLEAVK